MEEEPKVKEESFGQIKEELKNLSDVNENLVCVKSDLDTIKAEKESVDHRVQRCLGSVRLPAYNVLN